MRWPRRLIALFLISLLGLYPLLAPPPHRIDQAHCDLIKKGMTKDEVESIFGVPPGEYDFAEQKFSGYKFRVWVRATGKSTLLDLTSVAPNPPSSLSNTRHFIRTNGQRGPAGRAPSRFLSTSKDALFPRMDRTK